MGRFAKHPLRQCCGLAAAALALAAALSFAASARAEAPFGIAPGSFTTEISTNQAGAHPDLRTAFSLNLDDEQRFSAGGTLKDLRLSLPKDLIADPTATPTCPLNDVVSLVSRCPLDAAVGFAVVQVMESGLVISKALVFNISPYPGEPAAFAMNPIYPVRIDTQLRAAGDLGFDVTSTDFTEAAVPLSVEITFWGVPADHNGPGTEKDSAGHVFGGPSGEPRVPFVTNPTECSGTPPSSSITVDSWQHPGEFTTPVTYSLGQITGCDRLEFEPTISALPTTNLAAAPSGLDFDLEVPQNPDPDGPASAALRDSRVTLPAGMVVNPAAANGLESCSSSQAGVLASGRSNGQPAHCPDASKLGNLEAISPLIDHPLAGKLYLAAQGDNPFHSLLAVYLVIEDLPTGVLVKLAGKVEADSETGQLTVAFDDAPQLPLEGLSLHLFKGPGAALMTPSACGAHTTTSTLTPWSSPAGADAAPSSTFALTRGPGGGPCLADGAGAPNAPTLKAGALDPTAGAFSPLVLKLTRPDGSQPIKAIDMTLPAGFLGRLAGTSYCSDATLAAAAGRSGESEQASPSCPAASRVGSVDVGAGVGPTPFHLSGDVYLAGPYKFAPLSLATVAPAVAGPFDLGTVVVRTALTVDPLTAQIDAVSDPIPTILRGIPLAIRSLEVRLDKPDFTLNPTSCDPASIVGDATSAFDQRTSFTEPFQVGDCAKLGFDPRLSLDVVGALSRNGYPGLRAVLRAGSREARIAAAVIALPEGELLDLHQIGDFCARQLPPERCPRSSRVGQARVWSPLLAEPLRGPIYLRAPSARLPDLLVDLRGAGLHFMLQGQVAGRAGRLRIRFPSIPDVPLSKAVLTLAGGRRGVVVNSEALCAHQRRAAVGLSAHNGSQALLRPLLRLPGRC